MRSIFKYHKSSTLLKYVGKTVDYLDLSGNVKQSLLGGNKSRTWLIDVACHTFADTVLIYLPSNRLVNF